MAFQAGDRLGAYEVVGELGAGGMGKVYRVRNLISHREEAMKILLPNLSAEAGLAERFMREIQVQGRLQHPNIAALNTAFEYQNQLVMVMELVEGRTLQDRLKQGPLALNETLDYGCQILRALSYAHKQGVVHRDIKPANMVLTPGGVVKLLDFGIAKAVADQKLTMTGSTVGSLHYMAPEQIQGQVPDPRSDLYSLGISLYQFATGQRPIDGGSDYDIMSAHLKEQPIPPIERDPRIPESLSNIILMSLQKNPDQRFQSADAFLKALESAAVIAAPIPTQSIPMSALPASTPVAAAKPNHRAIYMLAGALAALCVLGVAAIQVPKWMGAHASTQITQPVTQPANPPHPVDLVPPSRPDSGAAAQLPVQQAKPIPTSPLQGSMQKSPTQKATQVAARTPSQSQALPGPDKAQGTAQAPPPVGLHEPPNQEFRKQTEQMRENLTLVATRMNAVNQSLDQLQRSQAASGLGLRSDMVAAQQAMQSFFAQSEDSLRSGDLAAANKQLARAEQNLEKLESFLGK